MVLLQVYVNGVLIRIWLVFGTLLSVFDLLVAEEVEMEVVVLVVLLDDELGQLVELLASSQDGKLLLLLENLAFLLLFSSFLPHEVLRLSVVRFPRDSGHSPILGVEVDSLPRLRGSNKPRIELVGLCHVGVDHTNLPSLTRGELKLPWLHVRR